MNQEDNNKLNKLNEVFGEAVDDALQEYIKGTSIVLSEEDKGVRLSNLEIIHSNAFKIILAVAMASIRDFNLVVELDVNEAAAKELTADIMIEVISTLNNRMMIKYLGKDQTRVIMEALATQAFNKWKDANEQKSPIDLSGSSSFSAVMDEIKRKTH